MLTKVINFFHWTKNCIMWGPDVKNQLRVLWPKITDIKQPLSTIFFEVLLIHNFIFSGLSLTKPTGKISMPCIVFCMKTLKCWKGWNFKMKCIKTLQIGNQQRMKIMISSPKSRGADPGHRRLKEKGISRSAPRIFPTNFLFIYFSSFFTR